MIEFADVDGGFIKRCPRALLLENSWVFEIIDWQEKIDELGLLPNAGGYFDQSSTLISAIEIIREMKGRGEYK